MPDRDEQNADDELFARIYLGLRGFAAMVGWPDLDPDDLVQEAVARTLRHGALSSLEHPTAYLQTVIVRLVRNSWRHRGPRLRAQRTLRAEATSTADRYPSELDELRRLEPADRAVVYLAVIEQRPYADIAQLLGIREATARKRASRALQRLRAELTETEPEAHS